MFEAIHDKKEVFSFVMKVLATLIFGDRVKDRIQIWTGIGSNEKFMTETALKSAYGGYYYEVNSGLFPARSVGSSPSATPDLALIHGKRICIQSECESMDALRVALLKQCLGSDTISARKLHKDYMSIICKALIILLYNEILRSDDSSAEFLRRFEINFQRMCFVEDPKLRNERKIDETLNAFVSSKKACAAFLSILISYYKKYEQSFPVPECVKNDAKDYIGDNDVILHFMDKYFVKIGVESEIIYLEDLWLTLTQDATYKADIGVTRSRDLNLKLKMKQIPTKRMKRGNCIVGYKMKEPSEEGRKGDVFA
jgi:putative DNA primase/helicase